MITSKIERDERNRRDQNAPKLHPTAVVRTGDAARDRTREILMSATEDDNAGRQLVNSALGRPRLDPEQTVGKSPLWQVRAPQSLDTAMRSLARAEGKSFSTILREAAREYIATHPAS